MHRAVLLLCLPLLSLAACDRRESETVMMRPQPVLPGTVSDAMLQTDGLRARAPFAEPIATGSPGAEPAGADAQMEDGSRRPARRRDRADRGQRPDATAEPAPSPTPETKAPASPRPTPLP